MPNFPEKAARAPTFFSNTGRKRPPSMQVNTTTLPAAERSFPTALV